MNFINKSLIKGKIMKKIIISSLLLLIISCSESKEKLILPEEVSPDVYKVVLENEDVKVLEVTFAPGQGDNMHEHGVITYYGIKGGKLQNTLSDGTVKEMDVVTALDIILRNKYQDWKNELPVLISLTDIDKTIYKLAKRHYFNRELGMAAKAMGLKTTRPGTGTKVKIISASELSELIERYLGVLDTV